MKVLTRQRKSAAAALCFAALAVCLLGGWNIAGLIPAMPYWCGAILALSFAALTVLLVIGCVYYAAFLRQLVRSFGRFQHNALASASGEAALPALAINPQFSAKYVVYAALYGIFTVITYYSGFRAGFCFSAGATDLVFSASLPAAAKTWMIIPLGIAAFVVFYAVFYFAITKFDLKTPGREDEDEEAEKKVVLANNNYTEVASAVLAAVGGKENVKEVGYCATRLRFEVKDNAKVDEKAVKAAGAAGVIRPSKNACQVIIGTKVQFVYDELKKML